MLQRNLLKFAKISYGIEIDHFEMTLGQIFRKKKFESKKIFLDLSHRESQKWLKMAFWSPKTPLKLYARLSNLIILL